jgi:hypothetical protein
MAIFIWLRSMLSAARHHPRKSALGFRTELSSQLSAEMRVIEHEAAIQKAILQ